MAFEKIIPNIHIIGSRISQPQSGDQQNKWAYFWGKNLSIEYYRSHFKFTKAFARSTSLILGLKVQNVFVKASHRLGAGGWICG